MKTLKRVIFPILLGSPLMACNSTDGERFTDEENSYIFASNNSVLNAFGASRIEDPPSNDVFRCPAVSEMSSESSLTVFHAKAQGPLPHFTLYSIPGIRSDALGGVGISLQDLPIGLLDIYQRCNSTSYEKLTTSCPSEYDIVTECSHQSGVKECEQIYEGTHQLVISAQIDSSKDCITEESDRSPYSMSAPDVAYACDAFSPMPLPAAYRGSQPASNCCRTNAVSTLDFCLKPCGCRTLSIQILPKPEKLNPPSQRPSTPGLLSDTLKIGVFSNVEGNRNALTQILSSMSQRGIDIAVNLGNLTKNGNQNDFSQTHNIIKSYFNAKDGTPQTSEFCAYNGIYACGATADSRAFPTLCNPIVSKTAFLSGLGEDELNGTGLPYFIENFGAANKATTVGKVQLIMIDTADASIGESQMAWLKSILTNTDHATCQIPAPPNGQWPSLSECREILDIGDNNTQKVTCRECIQQEAYCIPPSEDRSNPAMGPENCICVPASSKICPGSQSCQHTDGTESTCICTRDNDCGNGGTCIEGKCTPPLRLVFSYTPILDVFGSRNNAITPKSEASALMSLLSKSHVDAIFSGRILDYAHYKKAGIPMYITGGGGADMESFASKKHHWLYVEIPNAYSKPDPQNISVEVIEF